MSSKKLPLSFYKHNTEKVAKNLLGKLLVRILEDGTRLSGLIVETEAYLGIKDKACHTFGGRKTEKTRSMYLDGGHSYIYFIYGMYYCFNVVTCDEKQPEAVLIRALEPIEGLDRMKRFRKQKDLFALTSGPGKLCQALNINRELDGLSLRDSQLFIEKSDYLKKFEIISRPRIGIHYAEEAKKLPLRFYVKGNKFVSKS